MLRRVAESNATADEGSAAQRSEGGDEVSLLGCERSGRGEALGRRGQMDPRNNPMDRGLEESKGEVLHEESVGRGYLLDPA